MTEPADPFANPPFLEVLQRIALSTGALALWTTGSLSGGLSAVERVDGGSRSTVELADRAALPPEPVERREPRGDRSSFERSLLAVGEIALGRASNDVVAMEANQWEWSEARLRAFEKARLAPAGAVLGQLSIPAIALSVPVLEGTGDEVLDAALGHIEGTAAPGATGNVGIAGHRDGFFRALSRIARGDLIVMSTSDRRTEYRVVGLEIVDPEDVEVLSTSDDDRLTLVTCYPFYYVGHAPKRFIVHAEGVRDLLPGASFDLASFAKPQAPGRVPGAAPGTEAEARAAGGAEERSDPNQGVAEMAAAVDAPAASSPARAKDAAPRVIVEPVGATRRPPH